MRKSKAQRNWQAGEKHVLDHDGQNWTCSVCRYVGIEWVGMDDCPGPQN